MKRAKALRFGLQEDGSIRVAVTLDADTWRRWCALFDVAGCGDLPHRILSMLGAALAVGDQHLMVCRDLVLQEKGKPASAPVDLLEALKMFDLGDEAPAVPAAVERSGHVLH